MGATILFLIVTGSNAVAEERAGADQPWKKFNLTAGFFWSSLGSSIRIGSGIGIDIDIEKLLGLDTTNTVFRTEVMWRFTDNRRHCVDFNWFTFDRSGQRLIEEDIVIGNEGEEQIVIEAGTGVKSYFKLDIYEVAYKYSFFQDDRVDIATGLGLYVMPIKFGLKASISGDKGGSENFTAPLPVLPLTMSIALTPRWVIKTGSQIFYVEYENFKGSLLEFRSAVEYNPWKYAGFGLGLDSMAIRLYAEGEDWPGIDLEGKVSLNYTGLQFYAHLFF